MNDSPLVTVLMPVYNASKDINRAIDSILIQSFTKFELIILEDSSTDNSLKLILEYNDPRIRLVKNKNNLGLVATLNIGLSEARGVYIARMDADDISMPKRIEGQYSLLERTGADICGGKWEVIDSEGVVIKQIDVPLKSEEFIVCLANNVPFAHGSVMIRKDFITSAGLKYGPEMYSEDFNLWLRMFTAGANFVNLNEIIYQYRDYRYSISKIKAKEYSESAKKVRREFIKNNLILCEHACDTIINSKSEIKPNIVVNIIFLSYHIFIKNGNIYNLLNILKKARLKDIIHGIHRIMNA